MGQQRSAIRPLRDAHRRNSHRDAEKAKHRGYHARVPRNDQRPDLCTAIPGPLSLALCEQLAALECQNITCLDPEPIFWQRAAGANVWDVDGNRFIDLTAAFGVANVGHSHPAVVDAIREQAGELLHGMGDVYPPAIKVALLEALNRRFPGGEQSRAILGSSGSDAVEAALKTAQIATGHSGVIAFEGAYHGLAIGALDATWRRDFRDPFAARLADATSFARFDDMDDVERVAKSSEQPIGAVLVEPIQGRGGERVPAPGFLTSLRELCTRRGWLLIADEIYTGCGRTGDWFACDYEGVVPDLLCVGKGLASGMPISACLGRREVMDAWPLSTGEALHTQTFIGHPAGCAAALASLRVLEEEKLVERAARVGAVAMQRLTSRLADAATVREVRGRGLMIGIECTQPEVALTTCRAALERGVIALPSGEGGQVISITPPLSISDDALEFGIDVLVDLLR